jgi:DNA-binding MarR family transcriptional regulator
MQASAPPVGLLVAAIRRAVKSAVAARVEPLGLSPLQFWVLVAAAEAPAESQAALARRLRFDEPTVSRVVTSLGARGWLRTRRDEADRRRTLLALTPAGLALVDELLPIAAEMRAAVEAPLAPEEREQVRHALVRIADHLQQHLAGAETPRPAPKPRAARRRAGATR